MATKITAAELYGQDISGNPIRRKPADCARDINRVIDMVRAWQKMGCTVIYAAGKVTADLWTFHAEIDIRKGSKRGEMEYVRKHYNLRRKEQIEEHFNRIAMDPYDAVIETILRQML